MFIIFYTHFHKQNSCWCTIWFHPTTGFHRPVSHCLSVSHKYKGVHWFCPKPPMFVVYHKTMRKFCVANSLCFKDSGEWNTNG